MSNRELLTRIRDDLKNLVERGNTQYEPMLRKISLDVEDTADMEELLDTLIEHDLRSIGVDWDKIDREMGYR